MLGGWWVLNQVPDITPTYDLIDRGGVVVVLLLGIVFIYLAFQSGWIVPGWFYKRAEESEKAWKQQAENTISAVRSLTEEIRELNRRAESGRRQR